MYPYRIISNKVKTQKFLLTEDRMIGFKEQVAGDTATRMNFNEGYQLSRAQMKRVFKLKLGHIGSRYRWTFQVFESVPAVRIGCMKFEGVAFDAIKAWIGDRR